MADLFTFFIGIDGADRQQFQDLFDSINHELPDKMKILNQYDDVYGYHTFAISGTWQAYKKFIGLDLIKSLEHYLDF
jgi:hypothetical protein